MVQLQRQFDIIQVEVGGTDFSVWKIYLRASLKPQISDTKKYSDINYCIKNVNGPLVNEIKKTGVIIDRG